MAATIPFYCQLWSCVNGQLETAWCCWRLMPTITFAAECNWPLNGLQVALSYQPLWSASWISGTLKSSKSHYNARGQTSAPNLPTIAELQITAACWKTFTLSWASWFTFHMWSIVEVNNFWLVIWGEKCPLEGRNRPKLATAIRTSLNFMLVKSFAVISDRSVPQLGQNKLCTTSSQFDVQI